MEIKFKQYSKSDFNDLRSCMEGLQDYIVITDPLKRLRRPKNYGKTYTDNLIKKVKTQDGSIILAYDDKKVVGCIAGVIEKQSKDDLLECVPTKAGRILELFVDDRYRNQGIGKKLMKKIEKYIEQNGCDLIRVEVFAPNRTAHQFYNRLGYSDRAIDLIKPIK